MIRETRLFLAAFSLLTAACANRPKQVVFDRSRPIQIVETFSEPLLLQDDTLIERQSLKDGLAQVGPEAEQLVRRSKAQSLVSSVFLGVQLSTLLAIVSRKYAWEALGINIASGITAFLLDGRARESLKEAAILHNIKLQSAPKKLD